MSAPEVNVIDVVNPDSIEAIELRPQEILHVVFTRGNVQWGNPGAMKYPIKLQPMRYEIYHSDGWSRSKNRGNFKVVRHTDMMGGTETHFWFRVHPNHYDTIVALTERDTEIGGLTFSQGTELLSRLKVIMVVDAPDRRQYRDLMAETIWKGKDLLMWEAGHAGVFSRLVDEEDGYILNPATSEQVIFEEDQSLMLVEITEPTGAPGGSWKIRGTAGPVEGRQVFKLKQLPSRSINSKIVQRILVGNELEKLPKGAERKRLGTLNLVAMNSRGEELPRQSRAVHFWVAKHRDVTTEIIDNSDDDEEDALTQALASRGWGEPERQIYRSKVVIEEINEDLTTGVNLVKTFIPRQVYNNWNAAGQEIKDCEEIVDPSSGTWITVRKGRPLVIHLYKNCSRRPPDYKMQEWSVRFHGDAVKLMGLKADEHRQRFVFEMKDVPRKTGETLLFTNGNYLCKTLHIALAKPEEEANEHD